MVKYRNVAKKRIVESETSKVIVNAQPFILMILVLVLAAIFHKIWGTNEYLNLVVVGLSISTVILSYFTWDSSRARGEMRRFHSVATMLSIGTWIIFATVYGVLYRPIIDIYIIGGLTLAFSWVIRNSVKNSPARINDPFTSFFEEEGLEGAKLSIKERTAARLKGKIRLRPGKNTAEDVQKVRHKFASLLQVPLNAVRMSPDPNNASVVDFTVVKKDMLKQVIKYPAISESTSISEPLKIGVYEDSDRVVLPLQTKDLGASHLLIQGMNGSGKSAAALVIFAELFKRKDVISWVVDTVKGSQTLGSIKDGIDWIIDDDITANKLFQRFKIIIKDRADYLGSKNLDKWQSGCGLSFLHIHIEEASGLIANNPAFIKMMETARSVGIQITASLQRASHVAIDTAARAQFSSVLCFGVASEADARFALNDELIKSGANPALWRNSKPGYAYLIAPGIDPDKWTTPLRTYFIEMDHLRAMLQDIEKDPLDDITRNAVGDIYKETVPKEKLYDQPQSKQVEKRPIVESARPALIAQIEQYRADGKDTFVAPDFKDFLISQNRSRAWLHKELNNLIKQGMISREGNVYFIE